MPTDKELKERDRLAKAVDDTYKKSEELIKLNTIQKQGQKKYHEEYNALVEESKMLNEKLTALENKVKDKESRMSVLTDYINTLKTSKRPQTEFDEGLFAALLDKMVVYKDNVQVVWRDGSTA